MNEKQEFSAKVIVGCIIGIILTFILGFFTGGIKKVESQDPNIPSQREIQQRLTDFNDPRYDPNGVDGWIGTDSRTAWDNYTKDQYAIREFEGE